MTTTPSRGDTDQADTDPVRADPVRADPGGIDRVGPGRAVTRPPRPPADMRRHLPYTLPGLWFALAFTGRDADIDIAAHDQEFDAWQWMTAAEMLDRIVPFKRPTYDAVVEEFRDLVK